MIRRTAFEPRTPRTFVTSYYSYSYFPWMIVIFLLHGGPTTTARLAVLGADQSRRHEYVSLGRLSWSTDLTGTAARGSSLLSTTTCWWRSWRKSIPATDRSGNDADALRLSSSSCRFRLGEEENRGRQEDSPVSSSCPMNTSPQMMVATEPAPGPLPPTLGSPADSSSDRPRTGRHSILRIQRLAPPSWPWRLSRRPEVTTHRRRRSPNLREEVPSERPTAVAEEEAEQQAQRKRHLLTCLASPIIEEEAWNQLTGTEFQQHPETVEALAWTGLGLALQHEPSGPSIHEPLVGHLDDWVEWSTFAQGNIMAGDVLVWTGKSKRDGYGAPSPWIKTKSLLPMSVEEMVDLLLDSSRVKTYNPWSLGRQDCWNTQQPLASSTEGMTTRPAVTTTKIVKNRTQPPLGSKAMVSVTMLHARPVPQLQPGAWVVVSRAVGGCQWDEPADAQAGRSDILMGVNLLQPVDEESCMLIAVTHIYSAAVPLMLAERLGVKSAIKFVKDMRALKVPS